MDMNLLKQFTPAKKPLLDLVFQRVDDSMLLEIANADYGYQFEQHLKALVAIKRGEVPVPMKWHPGEVLELIRYSEPEIEGWRPGSSGPRGHWMRLFSCAVLILASAEPGNDGHLSGEDSTVIQFVDSAMKLGTDTSLQALQFLCWRISATAHEEWLNGYFSLGILFLSISVGKCDQPTARDLMKEIDAWQRQYGAQFTYCSNANTLRNTIQHVLIEPKHVNPELRNFGENLLRQTQNPGENTA